MPTSRSEVFKTNQLTMIEKRVMMQFIQACMKEDEFKEASDGLDLENLSFKQFTELKKWSPVVKDYLLNAVAMCDDQKSALQVYLFRHDSILLRHNQNQKNV